MTDETVRVWLVERSYGQSEDLVTLVYATEDGERQLTKQLSHRMLMKKEMTAAQEVDADRLESVDDAETRERYREEAERMADSHEPDEEV